MKNKKADPEGIEFPGYPLYPESDDIYHTDKKVSNINPDDNSIIKKEKAGHWNEKDFDEVETGDDLDVTVAEAHEQDGKPGLEDEENDYFSLGGDNHDDLEEDRLEYPSL